MVPISHAHGHGGMVLLTVLYLTQRATGGVGGARAPARACAAESRSAVAARGLTEALSGMMMVALALLALLLLQGGVVGAGAQEQVACDLSKAREPGGADAICADFCTYKCGFWNASSDLPTETGKPQNITLYRITPFNVSGIINKNTGDAPGDVGFFLERKNITQQCAKDPHSFGCFLDGDNMYSQFTVEVDGAWGP
jgi:hypothetical protein